MGTGATHPSTPLHILATGFGALLVLYALTAAFVVVDPTTESAPVGTDRPATGSIIVSRSGSSVTLDGAVRTARDREAVIDAALDAAGVVAVVARLEVDPAAPSFDTDARRALVDAVEVGR